MYNSTQFELAFISWLYRANKIASDPLHVDSKGIKYIKIFTYNGQQKIVFCFVEKSSGDVLYPASWHAPAKKARGNIYEIGKEGVGKYGALYLK